MHSYNVAIDDFLPCCLGVDGLVACQSEALDASQCVCVAIDARCCFINPTRVAKSGGCPRIDRVQGDQRVEMVVDILRQRAVRERLQCRLCFPLQVFTEIVRDKEFGGRSLVLRDLVPSGS